MNILHLAGETTDLELTRSMLDDVSNSEHHWEFRVFTVNQVFDRDRQVTGYDGLTTGSPINQSDDIEVDAEDTGLLQRPEDVQATQDAGP